MNCNEPNLLETLCVCVLHQLTGTRDTQHIDRCCQAKSRPQVYAHMQACVSISHKGNFSNVL